MLADSKRVCKEDETTVTVGGQLIMKAKFRLDASKTPKTIDYDVIDGPTKGKKHLGIYELNGDDLRLCVGRIGRPRPTNFAAADGSKHILTTYRRAEPK